MALSASQYLHKLSDNFFALFSGNLSRQPSFVGCFFVSFSELSKVKSSEYKDMNDCLSICRSLGVAYSWIGPNHSCWCRMNLPNRSENVSISLCSIKCAFDEQSITPENYQLCPDPVPVRIYATRANPPYHPTPRSYTDVISFKEDTSSTDDDCCLRLLIKSHLMANQMITR
ncbi:unnamed protein product [Trichobilharzia regenti]|nr:unnamed protein product [Trichobilharzia regenti]